MCSVGEAGVQLIFSKYTSLPTLNKTRHFFFQAKPNIPDFLYMHTKPNNPDFLYMHTKPNIPDFLYMHTKTNIPDFLYMHTKPNISDFLYMHTKPNFSDFLIFFQCTPNQILLISSILAKPNIPDFF